MTEEQLRQRRQQLFRLLCDGPPPRLLLTARVKDGRLVETAPRWVNLGGRKNAS